MIDITSAALESWQNDKKVTYITIVIFEFDVLKRAGEQLEPSEDSDPW